MKNPPQPMQFNIGGMHCAACSARVERVIGKIPGVEKASVNLATTEAKVWAKDGDNPDLAKDIMAKVAAIGFTATPSKIEDSAVQYARAKENAEKERKKRLARLWPMIIFSLPLLFVSMGHMLGMPLPAWLEPHGNPRAFMLVQLILTLPVVWFGRHFYYDGIFALLRKAPNMDSLVAVGTGAAFLYSLVNTALGLSGNEPVSRAMNLYYESCAVLLTMIEIGQFLEFTARQKASDAIGALLSLTPQSAMRLDGDKPVEVPLDAVHVGDKLLIRPGSRIPVDGTVLDGHSAVDLSLLTGESMPVPVEPQSALVGGSVNGEGSLVMLVSAIGQDTRLSRIIRLVRDAQGAKAPIARLADRVSYYFVPAVMLFAILSAAAWLLFSHEPYTVALTVFVAILVMACPCAMGLATPMSIMVGTGRGAQLGVLIKNGAALEQAGKITSLCVDKTGTLTTGKPALDKIIPLNGSQKELGEKDLLTLASSLEGRSEHPLGLAIIEAAEKAQCTGCNVGNVIISPGLGIAGEVVYKNAVWAVAIGNEAFMTNRDLTLSEENREMISNLADQGETPLLMAVAAPGQKQSLDAIFALSDQLRPETQLVLEKLGKMGVEVTMLTGDNERTAKSVATRLGIEKFKAGLLPAGKVEYVRKLQDEGKIVGMVGDGINDAPALALANVGMAVGSGVDVSAEAGDIVLMRGGMEAVLSALALSKATMRNIRENLGWAFGYNILGLPVAAGILYAFGGPMLSPMLAGLAMALSSFSVVTNALRLRWFGKR